MLFISEAFGSNGRVNAATSGSINGVIDGQAYNVTKPLVDTTAVATQDPYLRGFRYSQDGKLKIYDATAGLPAGTSLLEGVAVTSTGQVCVNIAVVNTSDVFYIQNGMAVTQNGRVYMATAAGTSKPVAAFSADDTTPAVDATVTFTDASTNTPTAWAWNFGDGSTSTTQSPTHAYAEEGTYTVTLEAFNAAGSDSEVKTNYITVSAAPSYTGPLDVVPGAVWAGSVARALSVDFLGETILTVRRDSDDTTIDAVADAVTGDAPPATISTFIGNPFNQTGAIIEDESTVVLVNATGVALGQSVSGTGIQAGAVVTDISSAPTIGISFPATVTNPAATLTFTPLGYGASKIDQSGHANPVSQATLDNQPKWVASGANSRPSLSYDGSDVLAAADTGHACSFPNGGFTSFSVVKFTASEASSNIIWSAGDGGTQDTGACRVGVQSDSLIVTAMEDFATKTAGGVSADVSAEIDGLYSLIEVVVAYGTNTILVNGAVIASDNSGDSGGSPMPAFIGTLQLGHGNNWRGEIVEQLVYPTLLSSPDRLAVRQNIATYYNITLP